jgi:hypothetical protein
MLRSLSLPGFESQQPGRPLHSLVTILTELYRFYGKAKLSVLNYHTMKTCGNRGTAPLFLTLAQDDVDGQLHVPTTLSLGKYPPLGIGVWLGSNVGFDTTYRKISLSCPESKFGFSVVPPLGNSLH